MTHKLIALGLCHATSWVWPLQGGMDWLVNAVTREISCGHLQTLR